MQHYPLHNLQHYKQSYNWDCGVSCVLMLLSADQRKSFINNFQAICQEEGFGQSTWTIDLCYLLKRFAIKHCMYTTMVGVNEDYTRHGYYNKIIHIDRERVQRRFDEATNAGIEVSERSVTMEEIIRHLNTHGPVIMLVDAGLLVCDLCKHNKLKVEFRRCFGGSYRGHYVVLVGLRAGRVLYRDPALSARPCGAAPRALGAARAAPGTDEDVIFIYNNYT